MNTRNLTNYERKKILDVKIETGCARSWHSDTETFDEYLDTMGIPKTSEYTTTYAREFINAEDFIEYFRNDPCDFVYDAKSGRYFTNFNIPHVYFLSARFLHNECADTGGVYSNADAYVIQGHGMFRSRAGSKILVSENMVMPEGLWFIKRDLEYV